MNDKKPGALWDTVWQWLDRTNRTQSNFWVHFTRISDITEDNSHWSYYYAAALNTNPHWYLKKLWQTTYIIEFKGISADLYNHRCICCRGNLHKRVNIKSKVKTASYHACPTLARGFCLFTATAYALDKVINEKITQSLKKQSQLIGFLSTQINNSVSKELIQTGWAATVINTQCSLFISMQLLWVLRWTRLHFLGLLTYSISTKQLLIK